MNWHSDQTSTPKSSVNRIGPGPVGCMYQLDVGEPERHHQTKGVTAFGNAFELGHASPNASPDASSKPQVTGRHVEHCEQDLAV